MASGDREAGSGMQAALRGVARSGQVTFQRLNCTVFVCTKSGSLFTLLGPGPALVEGQFVSIGHNIKR